ncbi:MAG TPA: PilZ domain-containing protein [Croceibacterium sp.]|nr:PilZ domain-containing protein [Croceibacterium sp.]
MTHDRHRSRPLSGVMTRRPHHAGDAVRSILHRADSYSTWDGETDRRHAQRFALLIRAAKLSSDEAEFLCVVRDASEAGVSVRLFHPLPPGVELTLEMPNGDRYPLHRIWEDEDSAGFRFRDPVELDRIIEGRSRFPRRPVRVRVEVPCVLLLGGRRVPATIGNLSQQGALIRTEEYLALAQRIRVEVDGLPEITAKVCWRQDGSYGLSFEGTFQFAELAALAFDLQRERARPGGTA